MNKLFICMMIVSFLVVPSIIRAENESLTLLFDSISQRRASYPENVNYQAKVITINTVMNKQWEPKKTTIFKEMVSNINGKVGRKILEVTETEDGKTNDVTDEVLRQVEKHEEKMKRDSEDDSGNPDANNSLEEFFPFNPEQRGKFEFLMLDDEKVDGKDVFVIETAAKTKDEDTFEGKYYINQKTFDILKIVVRPSKKPMFIEKAEIEMDFQILPEGNYVIKRMRSRAVAKLVVKTVRQVAEVEYEDYETFR